MPKFLALLVVLASLGGFYLYKNPEVSEKFFNQPMAKEEVEGDRASGVGATAAEVSTANSYEECLAEGGSILEDSTDKCLTKDGHVFIKGVIEDEGQYIVE